MIELIKEASTVQFIAALILAISGIMIVLQAVVRKWVWGGYVLAFLTSLVVLAVSLR